MLSYSILLCLIQYPFFTFAEEEARIIQGEECGALDNAESAVMISWKFPEVHCTGTILTNILILTAAHCSTKKRLHVYVIKSSKDLSKLAECSKLIARPKVTDQYIHPKYNRKTFEHDLAVFEVYPRISLESSFPPPDKAPHITFLPEEEITEDLHKFDNCTTDSYIMGWGLTAAQLGERNETKLRCARVPIMSPDDCQKSFPRKNVKQHICASNELGRKACLGDAGGPIICNKVQLGVISFGGCHAGRLHLHWGNLRKVGRPRCLCCGWGIPKPIKYRVCKKCVYPIPCRKFFFDCDPRYFCIRRIMCPAYGRNPDHKPAPQPPTTTTSKPAPTFAVTTSKYGESKPIIFGDYPTVGIRVDKNLEFIWAVIDKRNCADSVHQISAHFLVLSIIYIVLGSA